MRLFILIVLTTLLLAGCSDSGNGSSDGSSSDSSDNTIPTSMVGEWCTEKIDADNLGKCAQILNQSQPVVSFWTIITATNGNQYCGDSEGGKITTSNGRHSVSYVNNPGSSYEQNVTRELLPVSSETLFVYWNDKVNYTLKRSSIPWFCD